MDTAYLPLTKLSRTTRRQAVSRDFSCFKSSTFSIPDFLQLAVRTGQIRCSDCALPPNSFPKHYEESPRSFVKYQWSEDSIHDAQVLLSRSYYVLQLRLEYFLRSCQPLESRCIPGHSTKRQCCYKYAVCRTRPSIYTMPPFYRFLPLNFFDSKRCVNTMPLHPTQTKSHTFGRPLLLWSSLSSLLDTESVLELVH